ncbi:MULTISPECIES: homoserine O-acetyltransferase [unclassified Pseudoalteromonas]|uniref:E22 family MetX-like putative esterase n=1 Tax=Pseudoalteromonas TaxID=53246 RepID=UPI000C89FA8A|nr:MULTISPECIES: homoserine O-acetyltransferase [unclassified Pseudoalteromonas]QLE07795.1 homoserine O-acetyltransferase [Pseudoalteromonas shioyasakiensis]MAD02303.1 homoserine acetyltransferase [Pseudoalteromonas sp.]MCP4584545.1 homoserine O-acetyltransferase [Pseudoalteromonas sp.]NIZ05755.1 homoserine O-acetyltransferase [Pseudoalteromonas sp. HF66]QWV04467.1 homoserine O-acetyltransferase [Pseudoalteromonas shioyasakiensis]|tara:strand:+ start:22642 stop:23829 length:1188 start_codon:yes stop_codon:yes gene_type:complete
MKTKLIILLWLVVFSSTAFGAENKAETMLVEKQHFTTKDFTTVSGVTLEQVDIGWESYGKLNANKDNVILITHYFSGTSHAAGKYKADDALPGYWDAIIGPGKAIDTNKYYVISSDTLVNANWHDENVITTGPASTNPKTGKPYGLDFPVVTITDFVNVQKRLLESLGITKLHAVMGASMGSFQALEWATRYPDKVERLIHVIGAATMDAWTVAALEKWALPIRLDKNWQQGNYYGKERPLDGLAATMLNITQDAMHPIIYNASFPDFNVLDEGALKDIRTLPKLNQVLAQRAMARAKTQDANHVLYLVRASQLFTAGMQSDLTTALKNVSAKTLLLPATNDLLLRPENMRTVFDTMKAAGKDVEISEIEGGWGHLDGIFSIAPKAQLISEFLEE